MTFGPESDFVAGKAARQAEIRSYRGMVKLIGRPVPQPIRGRGIPLILVPGFISGELSLAMLARNLRRRGYRTFGSAVGANLGCTDAMVDRVVRQTEQVVAEEGRKVALVGHSRGGMIAKLVAQRRPDLVAGLIVLSAPVTGTLSIASHVRKQLEVLFRLNRRGVSAVMGQDCVTGDCAQRISAELGSAFPAGVAYTSVYSRLDAIIDWRTCLDPGAEQVEVHCSHTGMGLDPAVHRIVAERLAALSEPTVLDIDQPA
jgi:triacylglycerol lipase